MTTMFFKRDNSNSLIANLSNEIAEVEQGGSLAVI